MKFEDMFDPQPAWGATKSRKIQKRIVIEGDLILCSPAHFGNGDTNDLTDMPLLIDEVEKKPLLTGASLAGALRSYLRSIERGYRTTVNLETERKSACTRLFGGMRMDDEGEQSALIVDDAYGQDFEIERRMGVRIDAKSRTAAEDMLYSLELWRTGTIFPLRFELIICEGDNEDKLKHALATALSGLTEGGITLGARKQRGYGRISSANWRAKVYDLHKKDDLLAWLRNGNNRLPDATSNLSPSEILGPTQPLVDWTDQREYFDLHAEFLLDRSLLIRVEADLYEDGPDVTHISTYSPVHKKKHPVLPGSSLAGALRARAQRIANTLDDGTLRKWDDGSEATLATVLIERIFGADMNETRTPIGSKLRIEEHLIDNATDDYVQTRIKIDRFTGGAMDGALLNEQILIAKNAKTDLNDNIRPNIQVKLRLVNPLQGPKQAGKEPKKNATGEQIGLLLLLLKDLWTGDLPLGGSSSVGRGRLIGCKATLTLKTRLDDLPQVWVLQRDNKNLKINGDVQVLGNYVSKDLREYFER